LKHGSAFASPSWSTIFLGMGSPPVLCIACLWVRRRRERRSVESSDAGRRALANLRSISRECISRPSEAEASAVRDYIQERFKYKESDLCSVEITEFLKAHGVGQQLADQVAAWLDLYGAARFSGVDSTVHENHLRPAMDLITALEQHN
jgi:hypothetical protein